MHCARILTRNVRAEVVAAVTMTSTIFWPYNAMYSGRSASALVQLRIRMCALGELLTKCTLKSASRHEFHSEPCLSVV
jgi:hypothetical protein